MYVCMYSQTTSKQTHSIQMYAHANTDSFLGYRWFHINVVLTSLLNTNTDIENFQLIQMENTYYLVGNSLYFEQLVHLQRRTLLLQTCMYVLH